MKKKNFLGAIGIIVAVIIAFINIAVIVYCFCNDDKIEQKPNLVFVQPTTLTEASFFPIESLKVIEGWKNNFFEFSSCFKETALETFSDIWDELKNPYPDIYVPGYIIQIIVNKAKEYNIPERLLLEHIREENSIFDPNAVSPNGEDWGLVQINCYAHPDISWDQAKNPEFAINFQSKYLRYFYNKYKNRYTTEYERWQVALICYNCGEGNYLGGKVPQRTYTYAANILCRAAMR